MWVRSFPASPSGYRLSALDEARWTPDDIPHACGYMVVGVLGCWGGHVTHGGGAAFR